MKFRKKPVVIEAIQFTQAMMNGHDPWPNGVEEKHGAGPGFDAHPIIHTLEGDMRVNVNDWIVTGIKGEKYPCRNDIFSSTYEGVGETAMPTESLNLSMWAMQRAEEIVERFHLNFSSAVQHPTRYIAASLDEAVERERASIVDQAHEIAGQGPAGAHGPNREASPVINYFAGWQGCGIEIVNMIQERHKVGGKHDDAS